MTLLQREHPAAVAEFDAAVAWYEEREIGVGLSLIDRASQARQDIAEWPEAAQPFPGWRREPLVRSKSIRGFPYRIVYFVHGGEIVIVAYAHERRRPGYWKRRIGD